MKRSFVARLGLASLLIGTAVVGCSPTARLARPSVGVSAPSEARFGGKAAERARMALAAHDGAGAVSAAEIAAAMLPRDADVRLLLGQSYLAAGRFSSADAAFADALALQPDLPRASLGRALALAGLGRAEESRAVIATARDRLPAADSGLALALAGDVKGAIALMEPALAGGDARTRQNLALAYALDGDWAKAKTLAAQDTAPADLPARLQAWAAFAQPRPAGDRVAALLGTRAALDPGRPEQLAVADPLTPVPMAEPVVAVAEASAPASAEPATPVAMAAEAPQLPVDVQAPIPFLAAAHAAPAPRVAAAKVPPLLRAPAGPIRRAVPSLLLARAVARPVANGNFVVQLGAFSTVERVDRGWTEAMARFSALGGLAPSRATYLATERAATLFRLSVSGFATREEAAGFCHNLRSGGGNCFVRQKAGDAPIEWVSREGAKQA